MKTVVGTIVPTGLASKHGNWGSGIGRDGATLLPERGGPRSIFEPAVLEYPFEFVRGDFDYFHECFPVMPEFIPEPSQTAVNHSMIPVFFQAMRHHRTSIGGNGGSRVHAVAIEDDDEPLAAARREGCPELHASGLSLS